MVAEGGKQTYTCTQAAAYLGCHHMTVSRLILMQKLVGVKGHGGKGRGYQITQEALDAFRATHRPGRPIAPGRTGYIVPGQGINLLPPTTRERKVGYPVLRAVCEVYEIQRADLEGPSRRLDLIEARKVATWVLAHDRKMSTVGIGHLLKRDHATSFYHLQATCPDNDVQIAWGIEQVRMLLSPTPERRAATA